MNIFIDELLDQALRSHSSGLRIQGTFLTLEKARNRLSYLRKKNQKKYGHLRLVLRRAPFNSAACLDIINTRKTLDQLEEIFS